VADLVVAGAGMAGLAAAATARAVGAEVLHLEKGDVAGGAMRWSSGVIWRHADFGTFRRECPGGDEALQRTVFERLDADLDWLEAQGARVTEPSTGNPRTVGRRFDTASVVDALAGEVRLGEPLRELLSDAPVVLATGGFAASEALLREHVTPVPLRLRSTPWSTGDGLRLGLAAGGATSAGMDEIYGRAMPDAPLARERWITDAQLYARHGELRDGDEVFTTATWSEIDAVQWLARRPYAWLVVRRGVLGERTPYGTVAEQIARADAAGAEVRRDAEEIAVRVAAAVTSTLGGLRVDTSGHVAGRVWAAGADAGGIATGGYASGLAGALVLGRRAAEAALR
jgi:succinate dehydrogenase/fumarate reductase flavoprotein subunit